ncbi:MAG: FlgB family protein [Pseudomonadota bacterium]
MLSDLKLIQMASSMARHASSRMRVIAENVSNADTPGFKARDVKSFSAVVNEAFTPRVSRPGHLASLRDRVVEPRVEIFEVALGPGPNGNSVSLEDQALRAVETQGQHRLATSVYSKTVDILRLGLGRSR